MDLKLVRNHYRESGIFSALHSDNGEFFAVTLEHAYEDKSGAFLPKIPEGSYTCRRSQHRLHGMNEDFETFEIMGICGHTNLLFHWGNFNKDSEGCILLGKEIDGDMITESRDTFAKFMRLQNESDLFTLIVVA